MTDPVIIPREDAEEAGYIRFFTGKVCIRGHVAERYVSSGGCVYCAKLKNKAMKMAKKVLRKEIKRETMEFETPCCKTQRECLQEHIRRLDARIASLNLKR